MKLTGQDRDDLYADVLALDNLHSSWARLSFEATIEEIIARHVNEALEQAARRIDEYVHPNDDVEQALTRAARLVRKGGS